MYKFKILLFIYFGLLFSCTGGDEETIETTVSVLDSSKIFKKITNTTTESIIDFYVLFNSYEPCNIMPYEDRFTSAGYDYGSYHQEVSGEIIVRYDWNGDELINTDLSNLNLGASTFVFSNLNGRRVSIIGTNIYEDGTDNIIGFENSLPITTDFFNSTARFESIDSPFFFQILHKRVILKKQLNDGTSLPMDLWFSTSSPRGQKSVNGQLLTIVESKKWVCKFNGENWVEQELDIYGNEVETIPNICN